MSEGASKRATIVDLARAAGVSKSTVSLVLNGSPLVSEDKRKRVEEAIDAVGYVYNRAAARLRAPAPDVIGMIIHDLANPFFAQMMLGIEAEAGRRGVSPFLANTGEDTGRQYAVAKAMYERGAAGFILSPAIGTKRSDIDALAHLGAPLVLAIRRLALPAVAAVMPDNAGGARAAMDHLIGLGHTRIAFIGGLEGMVVRDDRLGGYRTALKAAGLPHDPSLELACSITRTGGATAVAQLLKTRPDVTAVLAFNDLVALGVMHGLSSADLTPGADIAVIGFDDVADARWARPALTTVSVDAGGLGAQACTLLFDLIGGAPPRTITHPARLVVRESCGASSQRSGHA